MNKFTLPARDDAGKAGGTTLILPGQAGREGEVDAIGSSLVSRRAGQRVGPGCFHSDVSGLGVLC